MRTVLILATVFYCTWGLAAKFIVENPPGTPRIVSAEGFVPKGAVPAPPGEYKESDLDKENRAWVVNEIRRANRLNSEATEDARLKNKRRIRGQKMDELINKFNNNTDKQEDVRDGVKACLMELRKDLD